VEDVHTGVTSQTYTYTHIPPKEGNAKD